MEILLTLKGSTEFKVLRWIVETYIRLVRALQAPVEGLSNVEMFRDSIRITLVESMMERWDPQGVAARIFLCGASHQRLEQHRL